MRSKLHVAMATTFLLLGPFNAGLILLFMGLYQKNMTLKHVTCNSFPWNKAGDFSTPILCPNADKNEIEAACASYVTSKSGNV